MEGEDLDFIPDDVCLRCAIQGDRVEHHRRLAEYHQTVCEEHLQLMRSLVASLQFHEQCQHQDAPAEPKGAPEDE